EGGVHSPFFMKWPAAVPAGTTYTAPVAQIDIFPTAAAAAQAPLPADRSIDGANLLPFVRGEKVGPPHPSLFWRSGAYKTVLAAGWQLQVAGRPQKTWLCHLDQDPTERVELSAQHPDKVRELRAVLAAHEAEMVQPAWPSLIEAAIDIDHPLGVPESPADDYVYWEN